MQSRQSVPLPRFWQGQRERLVAGYIGTIHGFCRTILRTFGYEERVAREAQVTFAQSHVREAVHDAVEEALLREDCPLLGPPAVWHEYELRGFVSEILDQASSRGLSVQTILDRTRAQAEDGGKASRVAMAKLVARAGERYRASKAEAQSLDTNDLLNLTASLLTGEARR